MDVKTVNKYDFEQSQVIALKNCVSFVSAVIYLLW